MRVMVIIFHIISNKKTTALSWRSEHNWLDCVGNFVRYRGAKVGKESEGNARGLMRAISDTIPMGQISENFNGWLNTTTKQLVGIGCCRNGASFGSA